MKKIIDRLKGNGFFASVMKVGSGNVIGQAVAVITTPILSRIYAEVAFGEQAIITSTATIVINVAALGLASAIMQPKDNDESKRVFTTAFISTFIIATFFSVACLILTKVFLVFNVGGSYPLALLLTWLYIVSVNTQGFVRVYVNRKAKYNKLFFNPIIGAICNIVIAIPLGIAGAGYIGLLLTTILSNIAMIIHMCWRDNPLYLKYRPKDFFNVLVNYKEYVLFQYPANLINNTATEYPTQFLGRCYSTEALAGYSMCIRILKYPIRLIASPISTVYFKTATDYAQKGQNIASFTYTLITRILAISFIPVAVCCSFSESIFGFVLGHQWRTAGTIASIVAAEYVMLFCTDCVSYCRVVIGKQKSNLAYALIRIMLVAGSSILGYRLFHSVVGTIFCMSICNSVLYVADMALNFYYLDKKCMSKYIAVAILYIVLVDAIVVIKMLV